MATINFNKNGYSNVNGLDMYYEIYGSGKPLVLVHGGGSTIQSSFGRIIPLLAANRRVIAMELQAHGRTGDRDTGLSFSQDAADIAALLANLGIKQADILGFSNGGQTAIELAIHHPEIVDKLMLCSVFYKRSGAFEGFWDGFDGVTISQMPPVLRQAFFEVNKDEAQFQRMFDRDVQRMKAFKGWTDEQIKQISAPTLVINGNEDVGTLEHAAEMYRMIPDCQLAVFPGGHGAYIGTIESVADGLLPSFNARALIETFLDK